MEGYDKLRGMFDGVSCYEIWRVIGEMEADDRRNGGGGKGSCGGCD